MHKRHGRFEKPRDLPDIIINGNDLDILMAVGRVPYATQQMVAERLKNRSGHKLHVRLKKLYWHGYLDRHMEDRRNWIERIKYTLTKKGEQKLAEHGLSPTQLTTDPEHADNLRRQHTHTMTVGVAIASIEAGALDRFIPRAHIMPKLARLPYDISYTYPNGTTDTKKGTITPDELFGITYPDKVRYFALETEHASPRLRYHLSGSSLHRKILAYQDIIKRGAYKTIYGIDNLRVMVTAGSEKRLQARIDLTLDTLGPSNVFLFAVVSPDGTTDLFTTPWRRAGLQPIRLDTNEVVL